jgi:recombination protein RecA
MFSVMALPASVLEKLGSVLVKAGVHVPKEGPLSGGLPLAVDALNAVLPDGGLLRGGVVELAVAEPGALGTSLGLLCCRAVQEEARARGATTLPWCAFVDPSSTLYAPGVAESQVDLERLLVVRPPLEALSRVASKLVESPAFALVVIDTVGMPGAQLDVALGTWPRVVRRLAMAVEGTNRSVLLLTDAAAPRPLPLPVAQRLELKRTRLDQLALRVAKDRRGRVGPFKPVAWTRPSALASTSKRFEHGLKIA